MCQFKFKKVYNELLDRWTEPMLDEHKYEIKVAIKVHKKDKTISYLEAFNYAFVYSHYFLKNNKRINEDVEYIYNVIIRQHEVDEMAKEEREFTQIYSNYLYNGKEI